MAADSAAEPHLVGGLPARYPRQVGLTCGEANAESVLEAFGYSYCPGQRSWVVRLVGYSLLKDLAGLLKRHGLAAPVRSAGLLSEVERLEVIRHHIDRDEPMILAIGNGHLRRDRDVPLARMLLGHYITVYGYNDSLGLVYIYDPFLSGEPARPLPAGNDTRSYSVLLRDWKGPIYYPLIRRNCAYIPVSHQP